MIHESYFWKKELYNSFLVIAKFRTLKRTTEQSYVKVEKALMLGAYIIRKLNDAQKLPPNLLQTNESIEMFTSKGTIVDHMNWYKIDKHYDLEKKSKIYKDWVFIINQIIHSYTLIYFFDKNNKLDGFLINSDKTKKKSLFFLPIKNLMTIFLTVSEGDITSASSQRELIGKEKDGGPIFGEMKLKGADYSYPIGFKIKKAIDKTIKGDIYKRDKNKSNF